jgi:pimeloyl-[acyl-carrier protein] methyl ester esterase
MTNSVARRWLVGPEAPPALIASLRAAISCVRPKVLAARVLAVLDCDVRQAASQVDVPTLYLQPTQDRLVSKSMADELQRLIPHLTVTRLDGPHLILQQKPRCSAKAITGFLSRVKREMQE